MSTTIIYFVWHAVKITIILPSVLECEYNSYTVWGSLWPAVFRIFPPVVNKTLTRVQNLIQLLFFYQSKKCLELTSLSWWMYSLQRWAAAASFCSCSGRALVTVSVASLPHSWSSSCSGYINQRLHLNTGFILYHLMTRIFHNLQILFMIQGHS